MYCSNTRREHQFSYKETIVLFDYQIIVILGCSEFLAQRLYKEIGISNSMDK